MNKNHKRFKKILSIILSVAFGLTLYTLYQLQMLPIKYVIPAVAIITFIFIGMIIWVIKSKGKTSFVLSIILSLALLFGVFKGLQLKGALSKLTGANKETHIVHVVVLEDSPYKSIRDIEGVAYGANTESDKENVLFAKDKIEKKYRNVIELKEYTSYKKMSDDLYSKKTRVLILSDSAYGFLDEIKPEFREETRILESFSYSVKHDTNNTTNVSKETFSVYISGIDTYGPIDSVSRSDVNMIATVNPLNHQILLTSIPRDYHVNLHSNGKKDKLSHTGTYGINETVKTVEDLFEMKIDYYLKVNFSSVVDIIDALGGVEVNSAYNFKSQGYTFKKGKNKVDGKAGLAFVRERKTLPHGDESRIRNQQALITGIINKSTTPAVIRNYSAFLNSVSGTFQTSMPERELNRLIRHQIDQNPSWEIIDIQVTGSRSSSTSTYGMPGVYRYVTTPNMQTVKKARKMIQMMEKNQKISKSTWNEI